ncbi:hypothetical protein Q427_33610 [Halomonas sp. BC04]|nr:hypothetical protein Q427_33610 [Halomonas sp. BC04]
MHAIDRLERDLEKALEGVKVGINYADGQQVVSARDVLFKPSVMGYKQAIPNQAEIMKEEGSGENRENYRSKILLFEVFGLAAAELNQIRLYAEGLKELESSLVQVFYQGTTIENTIWHTLDYMSEKSLRRSGFWKPN